MLWDDKMTGIQHAFLLKTSCGGHALSTRLKRPRRYFFNKSHLGRLFEA